jgi:transcriptional regulator SbtR-like protein
VPDRVGARSGDGVQPGDRLGESGAMQPSQTRDSIIGAVDTLLRAGADDGSLRSDVQADDVVSSLIGIFLASGSPAQTGRLLDLLVAGVATAGINRRAQR